MKIKETIKKQLLQAVKVKPDIQGNGEGLTGHGKMLQIQVEEYLVERIGDNMQFIKQYDLDLDAGLLYYSIYSRDDREAVEECMIMYCADIKVQFDIEIKPKFRL